MTFNQSAEIGVGVLASSPGCCPMIVRDRSDLGGGGGGILALSFRYSALDPLPLLKVELTYARGAIHK